MTWETAREGTLTGHGGKHAILFAVAAVSDQSGELRFAKQDFSSQPLIIDDPNSPLPTLDSTRLLARAALLRAAQSAAVSQPVRQKP